MSDSSTPLYPIAFKMFVDQRANDSHIGINATPSTLQRAIMIEPGLYCTRVNPEGETSTSD
jgi:hypothetical protein